MSANEPRTFGHDLTSWTRGLALRIQRMTTSLLRAPPRVRQPESPAPLWLIISAMLAGVALGICGQMRMPIEERLLDGSLVLSGQVTYPDRAVMGLYYHGVWTLLYQLGALVFKAGVSYTAANFIFLLIPPAILTGAFAMFIHGLTGRPLFSLVAAILCFMNGYFVSLFASSDYPLLGMAWNTPSPHSYGRFGAVLAAFSFAALVGGRGALAAFAAAGLVAIHPVIGVYTVTMLVFGLGVARIVWNRPITRSIIVGFASGACVTLASLAVFLLIRQSMPDVDEVTNRTYIEIYSSFWDYHRNLPATRGDFYRVVILCVVLAAPLLMLLVLRRGRRGSADAGAVVVLGAIAASTVLYMIQHWDKALLPDIALRAIPGRLINMQASFAMALVIGMTVFVSDEVARWVHYQQEPNALDSTVRPPPASTLIFRYPNATAAAIAVILAVRILPGFLYLVADSRHDPDVIAARHALTEIGSPFWSKVRDLRIKGLVLVPAELSLKALRYGRLPIALESAIDFIPYLPRTATALGTIIERGYGVSFFRPPAAMKFGGVLPPTTGRAYWDCLSPTQWQEVAQEFGIVALLVPSDWNVRLPILLSDTEYALYLIPTGKSEEESTPNAHSESRCPILQD